MALTACLPTEELVLIGRFERGPSSARRRASGGASVRIGPGVVWFQETFEGVEPDKILNRTVRPLLRHLTKKTSRPIHYFGRDWIACEGRPVGIVAFDHEATTGRGLFEAFVSARALVALGARSSYRDKEPMTLDVDPAKLIDDASPLFTTSAVEDEPPWEATIEDAIGLVAAGRDRNGVMCVGGEFMASSDVDPLAGDPRAALFGTTIDALREVVRKARA